MSFSPVLELMPWVLPQLLNPSPSPLAPYAGYYLVFYQSGGGSTHQSVYADWLGSTNLGYYVVLDANGYPSNGSTPVSIFLAPGGYKVALCPPNVPPNGLPNEVSPVRTVDGVENVGQTIVGTFGQFFVGGQKSAPDGYLVTASDFFVTFNGASTGVIDLPSVATRTQPLILMNVSAVAMLVTPNGSDSINLGTPSAAYSIAAGTTPKWPVIILYPFAGSNTWLIAGGLYTS